ncbi:MAG: hypothetical protein JO201_01865, partial [Verrucomicrobia bacterium]|nr:hypothetical protein [Verrucomicrobiota bacterium]
MNLVPPATLIIATVLLGASAPDARSQTTSVDQLIKKLPPPEKIAQSAVDPAIRDPLGKQAMESAKAMNFGNAYALSQKLASRYPKSAAAQCLYGQFALMMHKFPEAAAAFRKAIADQPNLAFAYLGHGLSEAAQQHLTAAASDYRQVTELAPKADVGWVALSACSEKMGRKRESLDYARQATAVAPSSAGAWY